jgi:hypothetical protein
MQSAYGEWQMAYGRWMVGLAFVLLMLTSDL